MARPPPWLCLLLLGCGPPPTASADPKLATGVCALASLTEGECRLADAMALPTALPPSWGSSLGDDEAAAALGYQLFFDLTALSPSLIRCASCHVPEQAFTTHVAQPRGVTLSPRNALSLRNAARTFPHFWDGSADSLWAQALAAIERDDELGGDRLYVAHQVLASYGPRWAALFGPPPDLSALPPHGKPGDAAWEGLSQAQRAVVDDVFVKVGKVLEAYVRRLASGPAPFDRFLAGDEQALAPQQLEGLGLFLRSGCVGCHSGNAFSDGRYHRLDPPLPTDAALLAVARLDTGRSQGLVSLAQSEFNARSSWYEAVGSAPAEDLADPGPGAYLTPSLRNVTLTGPWGHAGVFNELEAVVRFHLGGGGVGCVELAPRPLTDEQVAALVSFLGALEGAPPSPRWAAWPGASP